MAAIRYLVHDLDAALGFYTGLLGFTLERRYGPAMAIVARDGLALWLAAPMSSAAQPMPDGRRPEPGGWNRLVVEPADFDAAVAALRAAGVRFRNAVLSGPGGRQVLVEDPSGNPVELFSAA